MRLELHVLGTEVLSLSVNEASHHHPAHEPDGDCVSTPLGFIPSPGDQRWESGAELT